MILLPVMAPNWKTRLSIRISRWQGVSILPGHPVAMMVSVPVGRQPFPGSGTTCRAVSMVVPIPKWGMSMLKPSSPRSRSMLRLPGQSVPKIPQKMQPLRLPSVRSTMNHRHSSGMQRSPAMALSLLKPMTRQTKAATKNT